MASGFAACVEHKGFPAAVRLIKSSLGTSAMAAPESTVYAVIRLPRLRCSKRTRMIAQATTRLTHPGPEGTCPRSGAISTRARERPVTQTSRAARREAQHHESR